MSNGFPSHLSSDCGLKARKYYLLGCAIPIHRSTVEMRFFIVDLHLDIPIEIPIQSHTDLSRLAGGLRRTGQLGRGRPNEGIIVICLHAVARHEFERAPPSVRWRKRPVGYSDTVIGSILA